jgi:hypothetical protein
MRCDYLLHRFLEGTRQTLQRARQSNIGRQSQQLCGLGIESDYLSWLVNGNDGARDRGKVQSIQDCFSVTYSVVLHTVAGSKLPARFSLRRN